MLTFNTVQYSQLLSPKKFPANQFQILVISAALFQDLLGIFVLMNTAASIFVATMFTKYCPFNTEFLNYLQTGLLWTFSWSISAGMIFIGDGANMLTFTTALVSVIQNDSRT